MAQFVRIRFNRAALFLSITAGALFIFAMVSSASAQTAPTASPHIASIYPTSGPAGTQVTITGTGLSGADVISFGPGIVPLDAAASPDGTQLKFTVPAMLTAQCSLSNPPCSTSSITLFPAIYSVSAATIELNYSLGEMSNGVSFTVTPSVIITSVVPSQGAVGTQVTITGQGFSTYANAINFDMGSVQGVIPQIGNSSSVIKFVIPQGLFPRCAVTYPPCPPQTFAPSAGAYSVSVAPNFDFTQTSNGVSFNLQSGSVGASGPVITSITPSAATIGTEVTIKGSGFSPNLNIIDFGIGIITGKMVNGDLVFTIPTLLGQRCAFFSNPPCTVSSTVSMVPGTYNITVAASPTAVSNPATFVVTPIPLPTTPPVVVTSSVNLGVEAIAPLNVRESPSLSAVVLGQESSSSLGLVETGPVNADGYAWYQVDWSDGLSGWSVGKYLLAAIQSLCPITIGDSVDAVSGGENLVVYARSNPSLAGNISTAEVSGAKGNIISGPVVSDLYDWWNIRFADGTSGWVAESNFTDTQCMSLPTSTTPLSTGQAPIVSFVSPLAGTTVSGKVPLSVYTSSSFPITGVSYYLDSALIGTATAAPYTMTWDATQVYSGYHTLKAQLNTSAGISAQSSISVNVSGLAAPLISFVIPQAGGIVSGNVPLTAAVSTPLTVTGVDFYVDNVLIGTATNAPYTVNWDATKVYNGAHLFSATVRTVPGLTGSTQISASVTGGLTPPTAPTIDVSFVTPTTGSTVSGNVPVTVTVSSSVPIAKVSFYLDGQLIGGTASSPYTIQWDATQAINGWHTLSATAQSTNGYSGSRSITVNVTGGLSYPVVTITTPQNGATVSGQVPVTVSVTANRPPMTEVDLYNGGTLIGTSSATSYTATWDATKVYDGPQTLVATAHTTIANIAASAAVTVNVTGGLPPPAISVAVTAPQAGATVFGKIPIAATVSSTITVAEVDFYENGILIGTSTAPYAATWDATQAVPGTYSILAVAKATNGASASRSISVQVIAPPIFSVGEKVMVQTDSKVGLNARSGPGASYSIVGTEPNGNTGTILNSIPVFADTYNWWQVKYTDGVTGWSAESYLVPAP